MNLKQNTLTREEAQTLARLDQVVLAGKAGMIETNYGEIAVKSTRFHGFCAEVIDFNGWKQIAFGAMPSIAFLKLASIVKEING